MWAWLLVACGGRVEPLGEPLEAPVATPWVRPDVRQIGIAHV